MSKENKAVIVKDVAPAPKSWMSDFFGAMKFTDGWSNILTGLNRRGKDSRTGARVEWNKPIENELENMYAGDAMAAKYVDLPVDEAMQKGYKWTGITTDQEKLLTSKLKALNFDHTINACAKKARLYGGAALLKGYNDDLMLELPAIPGQNPILSLVTFQRFELWSTWEDVNKNILSPKFGTPRLYTFIGRNAAVAYVSNIKIDATRLIRFEGAWLPDKLRQSNGYWNDSILSKSYDAIRNYAEAHESVNAALKDLSVAVMKIKDLADKIAANEDGDIIKRLEIVNMTKSMVRAVVLDADGEEFDYKVRNVTGADKLVDKAKERLSAETGIPQTVFFGESPTGGGLGSGGEHSETNWYQWLEAYQKGTLTPPMMEIAKEVCVELNIPSENLGIEWTPLWSLSEKEEAEMRKTQAETDQIYETMGAVDAQEIRDSRFGGDKYSTDTKIDKSLDSVLKEKNAAGLLSGFGGSPGGKLAAPSPSTVEKKADKWVILSKGREIGRYDTKEEAEKRNDQLNAIIQK